MRNDLRINVTLTHTTSDELRVLRPEIEDQDGPNRPSLGPDGTVRYTDPTPCDCCSSLPSLFTAGATTSSDFWNSFTVP